MGKLQSKQNPSKDYTEMTQMSVSDNVLMQGKNLNIWYKWLCNTVFFLAWYLDPFIREPLLMTKKCSLIGEEYLLSSLLKTLKTSKFLG